LNHEKKKKRTQAGGGRGAGEGEREVKNKDSPDEKRKKAGIRGSLNNLSDKNPRIWEVNEFARGGI